MTSPVSIEMIKAHLRLEPDETGEDHYLQDLLDGATGGILNRIGRSQGDLSADEQAALRHAVKLLVGHWYRNREGVNVGNIATILPMSITFLIEPLRSVAPPAPTAP